MAVTVAPRRRWPSHEAEAGHYEGDEPVVVSVAPGGDRLPRGLKPDTTHARGPAEAGHYDGDEPVAMTVAPVGDRLPRGLMPDTTHARGPAEAGHYEGDEPVAMTVAPVGDRFPRGLKPVYARPEGPAQAGFDKRRRVRLKPDTGHYHAPAARAHSERSARTTSTRDARAAGVTDATIAASTSTMAAPAIGHDAGHLHVGDEAADDAREQHARRSAPATMPMTPITAPSRSTRVSRCHGVEPIASRTPNSRVRALTENASTPATPTTAISSATPGEAAEHERVDAIRRQHFGADVVERRRALHRLIARQLANDLRHRRHERVRIDLGVDEQPPAADISWSIG